MNIIKYIGLGDKGIWKDLFIITIGAALMGLGIGVFLVDAEVVPGGVTGIAMTVNFLFPDKVPVGLVMWILNIPLFFWGLKELGKQFGLRTFAGFTINAFFVDFFRGQVPLIGGIPIYDFPSVHAIMKNDFPLAILAGGVLMGIGLGLIFKANGSTAGSDIVVAIIRKHFGFKPGLTFMVVDSFVILIAGVALEMKGSMTERPALTLTLYAFALLIVSSRLVDVILDGIDYARSATIISNKSELISEYIQNDLSRGGTFLRGYGFYAKQEKNVIYSVLGRQEINKLVDKVKEIDPDAFIIVNNVHEVLGEGFKPRS